MSASAAAATASREQEPSSAEAAAEAAVEAVVNNGMWQPSSAVEMSSAEASALWSAPLDATDGDSDEDVEALKPIVIRADAPLIEGLRTLLVHHLKRSLASDTISLTSSQAELLEHHLSRLVSYAQKIVHTLAFATRFLAPEEKESEPRAEAPSEIQDSARSPPPDTTRSHNSQQSGAKKALRLNDDEILSLYRSAQNEAQKEADWRGLGELPSSRTLSAASDGHGHDSTVRSADKAAGDSVSERRLAANREYIHMLSKAMQSRGPAVASELVDATPKGLCCGPQRPTTLTVSSARPPGVPEQQRPTAW